MVKLASRNECEGFAERTRKNLEYIERGLLEGADVHVVTQLVNSLLGLIYFPYLEEVDRALNNTSLNAPGWPKWELCRDDAGDCSTVGRLVTHVRNAVSHRHFSFSSDSRRPEEVVLEFNDRRGKSGPWNWCARITGHGLREFCLRFAHVVIKTVA